MVLGLSSFRFETLKDFLQVTKNHLFIRDLGISTQKSCFVIKSLILRIKELKDLELVMLRLLGKCLNLFEILKLKSFSNFMFKYFGFLEKKNRRYKIYECE